MKTLTIFILTFLASCINLQENSEYLIGKWECYHKEKEDGTTNSIDAFSGKEFEYSCDGITIELNSDFTGSDDTGLEFKYQIKDSILTLGNRSYIVEELTKTELVIRNYDPNGISLSNFRTKFRKQE